MKLNKYFMLGLAGLAFAACGNDDEAENALAQSTKQVTVTIKTGDYTQTKATGAWTTANTITAANIKIYLLDGNDKIVEVKEETTLGEDGTFTYTYHAVSKSVQKIAAVANCPTAPTTGEWSAVTGATFNVADNQTAASTPLFAAATNLGYKGVDTEDGKPLYTASLQLATMLSRIELSGNLQCTNLGTSAYSSLVLKYVGVNNVNTKFTLTGTGSVAHSINSALTGFPDLTATTGTPAAFYDAANPEITLNNTTAVVMGQTYGYSVCGMPTVTLRFDSEERAEGVIPPHIVYDPAYLKIVGFKDSEGNTVAYAPGNIYQITNIIFTEEDITTLGEDKICVEAVVSVKNWEIVSVTPEFGK